MTSKTSVDKALAKFAKNGATDKQIARILTSKENEFYQSINSVFSKASALATYNEFYGDPNLISTEIKQYQKVTKADLMRVFNQYILDKNFIATSFVPKGQTDLVLTGAVKANVKEEKIVQGAENDMAKRGNKRCTCSCSPRKIKL